MKHNRVFKKYIRLVITLCLAMVFATTGCGRNTGQLEDNTSPEKTVSEKFEHVITEEHAATSSGTAEPSGADTASVVGPYGQISVYIPASWTAEAVPVDSDKMMFGLYGLILKPKDAADGHIELFCSDSFGVCGTGLLQEEQILAGQSVHIGTYDSHAHWDFITFGMVNPQVVAQHTDCDSWTDAMWEEALSVLDTMQFNDRIKEGGVGQFIRESENDEIAVIMEVDHVTASGLTVRFQQYDKRDAGELLYGEGYSLQVLNGDAWENVPTIIDNGAFHDEGYVIPSEGKAEMEINWEWLYGKLTPGTYRITKSVWYGGKPDGTMTPAYPLTAQFIIAG